MKFLARPITIALLLISCASSFHLKSQIRADKKITPATISGRVTMKGKGVSGIVVVLRSVNDGRSQASPYHATTDEDGNYRLTDVPPGSYNVAPAAPAFVVSTKLREVMLIVNEGESVENIDFVLQKGGVITGRVKNSEGHPLIEQQLTLLPLDPNYQSVGNLNVGLRQSWLTDDRGVYRIFGISEGKYKVGVNARYIADSDRSGQTFYPDVTDSSKAAILEIAEGSELTGIDITVEQTEPVRRYAVSGRIVDGESGQPVPKLGLSLETTTSNRRSVDFGDFVSDQKGQFRLENLAPGKYGLRVANNQLRSDAVTFEIVDQEVTGLLLKTYKGASVSGQIVFEGSNEELMRAKPRQLLLHVSAIDETRTSNNGQTAPIGDDLAFHVGGLPAGTLSFFISSMEGRAPKTVSILRVERDGIVLPRSFEIKDGEQLTELKLVVIAGSGTIRGIVKVENGELPPRAHIAIWFTSVVTDPTRPMQMPGPVVDSRGHFVAEGLVPGTYEINAAVYMPEARTRPPSAKQQVTVTDGGVTEVTITVDLTRQPVLR